MTSITGTGRRSSAPSSHRELSDGTSLQAYKHIDTRRYIHLDPEGAAFAFESPDRYGEVPIVAVLTEVFRDLPGLRGVTLEQICASWEAVERLARH